MIFYQIIFIFHKIIIYLIIIMIKVLNIIKNIYGIIDYCYNIRILISLQKLCKDIYNKYKFKNIKYL